MSVGNGTWKSSKGRTVSCEELHPVRGLQTVSRRRFVRTTVELLWAAALAELSGGVCSGQNRNGSRQAQRATAKSVIYMHQLGAPSQIDLFDYKPQLAKWHGKELPESVRTTQRLTAFTANQGTWPVAASPFAFRQHGQSGRWLSELLPHLAQVVDQLCFIYSLQTDAINHVTGASLMLTGSQRSGRPAIGAWVQYGLGRISDELPAYVVLTSKGSAWHGGESLQAQLWSSGFLPNAYQGVQFRSGPEPVLYLSHSHGMDRQLQRQWMEVALDVKPEEGAYPDGLPGRQQWETAFRMQAAVPELLAIENESQATLRLYGPEVERPGSFAYNCLLARRLVERGVRFVQLFHRGWDHHEQICRDHPLQARDVDQPSAALVKDLRLRGLLDETLVIWGSEFGRTVYCQGSIHRPEYGRDHHAGCFTIWMAGGGVRAGHAHGITDEFSYQVLKDPVHVHDLNATVLACLGLDHEQLTYRYQGRDIRLTDTGGRVIREILDA